MPTLPTNIETLVIDAALRRYERQSRYASAIQDQPSRATTDVTDTSVVLRNDRGVVAHWGWTWGDDGTVRLHDIE